MGNPADVSPYWGSGSSPEEQSGQEAQQGQGCQGKVTARSLRLCSLGPSQRLEKLSTVRPLPVPLLLGQGHMGPSNSSGHTDGVFPKCQPRSLGAVTVPYFTAGRGS